ncbi:MAG: hypothetical protein OSB27_10200 [Planktomarina sp.]|nr:hypothetical protein [Planktomarina sp.]
MISFRCFLPLSQYWDFTPVCGLLQAVLSQSKNSTFGTSESATPDRHWCPVRTHQARLATDYYDTI